MIKGHKPKYERAEGILLNKKELRYLRLDNTFTSHPVHADHALLAFIRNYSGENFRSPSEYYTKMCRELGGNSLDYKPIMK